jgi:hypothetical protein
LLLDPESLYIGVGILIGEVVEHAVVLIDLIELAGELINLVRGVLDKLTGLNKLALVLRLLHNCLIHLLVSLVDLFNALFAPLVDILEELLLDFERLLAQLLLHLASHHTEHGKVDDIV